jgi:hypothetical protein
MISADMIAKAQGARFVSTKAMAHDDGHFRTATCYYRLLPEHDSVSLEIISRSQNGAVSPRELWKQKFQVDTDQQRSIVGGPKSQKEEVDREDMNEAENLSPPERVFDVGDEAFWVDTGRDGALYVLGGERIIRVSLGGRALRSEKRVRAIQLISSVFYRENSSK